MGLIKKGESKDIVKNNNFTENFGMATGDRSKSIIGKTLTIDGEIKSDEDVFVQGRLNGQVNISKALIVGKDGFVNAEIKARTVKIYGKVEGNIDASYKVEIVPEGKLFGDIKAPKFVIEEGAIFRGNVSMKDKNNESAAKTDKTKESQKDKEKEQKKEQAQKKEDKKDEASKKKKN